MLETASPLGSSTIQSTTYVWAATQPAPHASDLRMKTALNVLTASFRLISTPVTLSAFPRIHILSIKLYVKVI